jgi:TonB family protein
VTLQDPQNEEARDGMRRRCTGASARIRADLNAGKEEEAVRLLAAFRGVGVDPATIKALEVEIAADHPRALVAQARAALASGDLATAAQLISQMPSAGVDRAVVTGLQSALDSQRASARLTELANRAHALIKAGALLEPAGDSAQAAVLSMQQLNRSSPLTLSTEHELQTALLERTLTASRASQFELAQQLLNAAAILGNGPDLAEARAQLQTAVDAAHARAVTAAAPVTAPTVATIPAEPDFVRAKPLDVTYPLRAFDAGQSGYVIVEFTLDSKGRASDAKVIESNPARTFDDAALQAVRHGRFDATALADSGRSQRARIRIAFQPLARQPGQ